MSSENDFPRLVKIHAGKVLIRETMDRERFEYKDTVANYKLDSGQEFEPLPEGYIGRTYIPGVKNRYSTGSKQVPIKGGWPFGDSLFPQVTDLLASQDARNNPPPPPPTREEIIARKKGLAVEVLNEEAINKRAQDPDVPQEVIDYINERNKPARS